ncbi:MAG TPA: glycosyl hydrolase family 18 protein [Candidatus Paceibacterota bacterium]|nr:glycosyl hydrolase family 18 protein [Candidatus Paceibacterota bacterium]
MKPRFFSYFSILALGLLFLLPSAASAAPLKNTLEVSGWIPYWREATGTADVMPNIKNLTAIQPFGYIVNSDGILTDAMGIADEPWKSLRAAAKANKVRFIPTVMWSDGASIQRILSNQATRIDLEDRIAQLAKDEGFDGIDIDFEAKYAETRPYFSLFLKGLYQRMGPKWVYCSIESRTPLDSRYEGTPPKDAGIYANDFVEINKYCDRVQIMAYDQGSIDLKLNASNAGPYAPIADINWVEKVMKVAAQTISKKKLVLGIPTYGYEYAVTPLAQEGYRYDLLWAFNQQYAYDIAKQFNLTPYRSSGGEMTFTYIPTSTPTTVGVPNSATAAGPVAAQVQPFNILTWDDSLAIAQKIALAKRLGLKGVAIFKFDGGEDQAFWNLIK